MCLEYIMLRCYSRERGLDLVGGEIARRPGDPVHRMNLAHRAAGVSNRRRCMARATCAALGQCGAPACPSSCECVLQKRCGAVNVMGGLRGRGGGGGGML